MIRAKTSFIISCLLLISTTLQICVIAQDEVVRIENRLVTVPTTVLDRDGRFVTNLKQEDFRIFEDGIEQRIEFFEPTDTAFTVLLLLDRSGSMSGEHQVLLAEAANLFVEQLRPDDKVAAATFADEVIVLFEATKVRDLKKRVKVESLFQDSTTNIYDAVDWSLRKMKKIKGRKAIVLFSDGVGDGKFSSAEKTLRDAEEQDLVIYTVRFDTSSTVPAEFKNRNFYDGLANANRYMRQLAWLTGGRSYQIEGIDDLAGTFRQVADELGRQYALSYYPKTEGKKGERRQIQVKVHRPGMVVRARNSYIVGSTKR